jgi:hypothetical protein
MSSSQRQIRLVKPSRHQAREAWLSAREVTRACRLMVTKLKADLKAAAEALTHAIAVEEDNADEWESLLMDEQPKLTDTVPEDNFDPLRA